MCLQSVPTEHGKNAAMFLIGTTGWAHNLSCFTMRSEYRHQAIPKKRS